MKEECNYVERNQLPRRSDGKREREIFTEERTKSRTEKETVFFMLLEEARGIVQAR
jgi:hypothetical protein